MKFLNNAALDLKLKSLTLVSAVLLILGLTLPTLKITKFFVVSDTYSILGFVFALFANGEYFLFLILSLFSIVFPFIKVAAILRRLLKGKEIKWLENLGKWSMAEVFLAALFIFSIKMAKIGTAVSLPGLYFFTASILLTAWISTKIKDIP